MSISIRDDRPAAVRQNSGVLRGLLRRWPTALAVVLLAVTAIGLADGRELAAVLTASGLIYLLAAASGWPNMAWVAMLPVFSVVGLGQTFEISTVVVLLGVAAVAVVAGTVRGQLGTVSRQWQVVGMGVYGGAALLATYLTPTVGGVLVAIGLYGHAAWDAYHHRVNRIVPRPFAEFCAVVDVLLACLVLAVTVL